MVTGGFALCLLGLVVNGLSPQPGDSVAVLASPFAPPQTTGHVVARSGGWFEATTLSGHIVVARSTDRQFINTLYTNGAWLVFNPRVLTGCRPNPSPPVSIPKA
ncbi:hypothetical protein AEYBE204_03015 [Asticcacaulis sp. YBE204]|nr:hypothetical protein AEYBE204_03015 [Asticcacaulis sp. YBE204]